MKIFAISDLHLSINNPKPMDIFGEAWTNYVENIFTDWKSKVSDDDLVLLSGDFSWAMTLENAVQDFNLLASLPGKKIIIRGNHDYWWKSISAVRKKLPQNFYALQNDAIRFGNIIICGTRGWAVPENISTQSPEDKKIFDREVIRLKLALESAYALKQEDDKIVCMMHYPPVNFKKNDSEFSQLLQDYRVDAVVYGHLHGIKTKELFFTKKYVDYYLTSCDLTLNKLVEIKL